MTMVNRKNDRSPPPADAASKARLAELESELAYINKTKEKYVEEHPEARDLVFRNNRNRQNQQEGQSGSSRDAQRAQLYDESGKLRDPKRSVYYDPVYNPFGVPPPGMPYRERTPEAASEDDSEEGDEDDSDDDEIVMPEGPPPAPKSAADGSESDFDNDSDDSDDIPLPEGPPPPKPVSITSAGVGGSIPPPMRLGFGGAPPPPFPPPSGAGYMGPGFRPPPPRPVAVPLHALQYGGPGGPGGAGPSSFRPPQGMAMPRPPRGVAHPRPPPTIQDPLSDAPTQTFQGHRMAQHALPARPGSEIPGSGPSTGAVNKASPAAPTPVLTGAGAGAGEISAAPVLRDLRKEATVFVPRGVKRKKVPGGGVINAAPGAGEIDEDGDERKRVAAAGGGLMGKLSGVLGSASQAQGPTQDVRPSAGKAGGSADDDYQKFLEGLGDLS
ncbi:hypothetical protein I317_05817 [Kwoniella heveanensis CBS 569]|nr:hypothetical protein I317_05817 [Kwoniella heveanensis CBS 569]